MRTKFPWLKFLLEYRPDFKGTILIAFLAALITYVGFSFRVPDNFFIAVE